MEILKIGILGIAGVMVALQFKTVKPEISLYMGLAVSILIFSFSLDGLFQILRRMEALTGYITAGDSYFRLLFKAVGITYICEFSAGICKDAGFQTIAGQIEVFGKVCILLFGLPIVISLMQTIGSFV